VPASGAGEWGAERPAGGWGRSERQATAAMGKEAATAATAATTGSMEH